MLNINVTITNKSQLKQKVKVVWAVFDRAVSHFGHPRVPFWTSTMGCFVSWAVLVISQYNYSQSSCHNACCMPIQ